MGIRPYSRYSPHKRSRNTLSIPTDSPQAFNKFIDDLGYEFKIDLAMKFFSPYEYAHVNPESSFSSRSPSLRNRVSASTAKSMSQSRLADNVSVVCYELLLTHFCFIHAHTIFCSSKFFCYSFITFSVSYTGINFVVCFHTEECFSSFLP